MFDAGRERITSLLGQESLSQSDIEEIRRLANLGGRVPICDGFDRSGKPFWYPKTFTDWAQRDALYVR